MLPRRNSTNVTSSHASPRLTSGGFGGRRTLSLATDTDQQTFHASTTEMLETESPQSETLQQPTSLIPPQRTSFSHSPPSGLRRQSTRQNTYNTYTSALDERVPTPSQPPNIPISVPPFPQLSEHPPLTPMQHQQPAPGGGVGGFIPVTASRPGFSPDNSHYNTEDYTYRFYTMPSPHSDSDPPHYESADVTGGIHAKVWPTYNKISRQFDENTLKNWDSDFNVLFIFSALFSAIVTAFLIRALDDLEPNYQQQSALILHQLLNGRDPSLASISDPTKPFRPSGLAIAVNCLWFASLSASLGASFGAVICKEWLTDYTGGTDPVLDLIRACQRHLRVMAFQRWNVHSLVALLSPLLHSSVILFFMGAVVYLWRMDERVAIVYQVIGGIFAISYFISTVLPLVTNAPFRPHSTLLVHRLSVTIGKTVIPIVDILAHACYLALRYVTSAVLWPLARVFVSDGSIQQWYMRARTILPGEYKHIRVWWANVFDDSLDKIDTSQKVQEEAILWLSQMPLDPSEAKAVVSSLALISSSRPHRFPKSVIVFLNLTLESSFREELTQEQTDNIIDCVLVLGHIKFQSVVDQNSDHDHSVGGIPVTGLVAWAAQQLTVDAFRAKFNTPHSEAIRARLVTAAAWLSPVDGAEDVEWNDGEKLRIQDRWEFVTAIKMMLERHVRKDKPLDNEVLINLVHGMHACIPRDYYGTASSVASFLPLLCEDYDSSWSEDEAVLRALITYALDLLLPRTGRKPLVEREIEFDKLALELIDTLRTETNYINIDVATFGFWLIYRVPYAFRSRRTLLADIVHIWTVTDGSTPEDHRERMNIHALDALVAVAQLHAATSGELPRLTPHTSLELLKAALRYDCSRPMATYAMAMILNLGISTQGATFMREIGAESFRETLFNVRGDLERNVVEEDIVDLHIYSALALSKFRAVGLEVERVKALIGEMEKVIGDTVIRDPEVGPDLDRVRWKAIYLSALLFTFIPEDEKEERTERFWERVRGLLRSGGLSLASDYERCLEPLAIEALELESPTEQRGPVYTVFEEWIEGFPLFPLAGSITSPRM